MIRFLPLATSVLVVALATSAGAAELQQLDTRHYLIHTDLDPDLAANLGQRLDAMYEEYNQRLALFRTRGAIPRLEVYLFRTQRDYSAFTRNRLQNSGGVFLPQQNRLAAFLGDQGRDQLRRTLQHEAFHQFAYNAIAPDLPVWLNEGLAQYFEEGLWNGDGFLLGEVPPRRVRQLRADLQSERLVPFGDLLTMTNDQWARRLAASRQDGVTQYNQSWAMVHFLAMAQNARGEYLYRARLLQVLNLLHKGASGEDAFRLAFGGNVEGFQQRFKQYARGLKCTPEATLIENQCVVADLMVDLDKSGRRFDDVAALQQFVRRGHYHLHYSRGDLSWDTEPDMACYFSDLNGRPFDSDELYLSPRASAPLPDLVCRCAGRLLLRTRFHEAAAGQIDHELVIEPLRSSASISN